MTPDVSSIKKICSLFKALLKRMSQENDLTLLVIQKVEAWIDVAAGAMALIGGNAKLRDGSPADFMQKDPKNALIRAIVVARNTICKKLDVLQKLETSEKVQNVGEGSWSTFFSLQIPDAVTSELDSSEFDDLVAAKCASLQTILKGCADDAASLSNELGNHGASNWKHQIPEDASFQIISEIAQTTVLSIPPQSVKDVLDKYLKALGLADH